MEIDFWKQRWQQKQIGFHLDQVNANLLRHWHELAVPSGSQVLVPLCGKSLDMLWLQNQHKVLGVECSAVAVSEFFSENKLDYTQQALGEFNLFRTNNIELWQGDFFAMPAQAFEQVRAVYDRASLVALPPDMRRQYAQKLVQVLPSRASILLVVMEYNQQLMSGPPFSVSMEEVQDLFGQNYAIHLLHETDILASEPRFAQRGLDFLRERALLLQPCA
jgi:thiopurine S-methyltransferase